MTDYIQQYKQYHEDLRKYPGNNLEPQLPHILQLIQETHSTSLLDYGCGKGYQYKNGRLPYGFEPALYDPAVPEHDTLPEGQFHGVISTDVMEHIPEEQIPHVFKQISEYATRFVFLAIATDLAIAKLPNGENAHCTIKPLDWWVDTWKDVSSNKDLIVHIKTYGQYEGYARFIEGQRIV